MHSGIDPTSRFWRALVAFVLMALSSVAFAGVLTLYVSPHGSDKASGSEPGQALRSVQKAFELAYVAASKQDLDRVRIEVAPGRYLGQRIKVRQPPAGVHFEVSAQPGAESRPIFDGNGKGGTWFILQAATQNGARFTFSGLEVAKYRTALSFNGKRDDVGKYLGDNVIENMVFRDIGQIAKQGSRPSTAAVRLVNARNNIIRDNMFINIRNEERCELLHSIYVAHHSSGNQIIGNTFDNVCGSPIRLRDRSNDNVASGNTFRQVNSNAVFDEWYCNSSRNRKCTKQRAECPSWGNRYEDNKIENSSSSATREPTVVRVPEIATACVSATARTLNIPRERIVAP